MDDVQELLRNIELLERRKQIYQLEYYKPYDFQLRFHNAIGKGTDQPAVQKALQAANQIGKTYSAAIETAIHMTGRYPDWWKGTRFRAPVEVLIGSNTNETARDICQKALLGDPTDEKKLGYGTIPINCIGKVTRKAGVPNAIDVFHVKHVSGGFSKGHLRAYEQGPKKFMGVKFQVGWADEEPPWDIWSQFLRGTIAQRNSLLYITYTPEEGMTEVVTQFMNNLQKGQALVTATWDDAPHLTPEMKAQRLAALKPHERDMRSKGIPLMGSGLIFQIPDDNIIVEPFEIPRHWPQIVGIDFGYDHPFAAARIAWDRDSDIVYIISEYREERALPAIHAQAIKAWGDWPVSWPHDGLNTEKSSGEPLADSYRKLGLQLLPWRATNPPSFGQREGEGGNSVEASVMEMIERMETGRLKVFKTCSLWFNEKSMYHRDKHGKIVKQ